MAVVFFRRCCGGASASENGAGMGVAGRLPRPHKVTKRLAGADPCTISVPEPLIVARPDQGGGFVTFYGPQGGRFVTFYGPQRAPAGATRHARARRPPGRPCEHNRRVVSGGSCSGAAMWASQHELAF